MRLRSVGRCAVRGQHALPGPTGCGALPARKARSCSLGATRSGCGSGRRELPADWRESLPGSSRRCGRPARTAARAIGVRDGALSGTDPGAGRAEPRRRPHAGRARAARGHVPVRGAVGPPDRLRAAEPAGGRRGVRRAFAPGDGAGLRHRLPPCWRKRGDRHARLVEAAHGHPDIERRRPRASPRTAATVLAVCDSYVSLHRAEAFGLTMAEAMWLGKPVDRDRLLRQPRLHERRRTPPGRPRLVAVGRRTSRYPPTHAGPSRTSQHAAALMRAGVRGPRRRPTTRRARARDTPSHTHSPQAAGELLARRLSRSGRRARSRASGPECSARAALRRLPLKHRAGPRPAAPGAGRAPSRAAAQGGAARDAARSPRISSRVNAEIVAALAELSREHPRSAITPRAGWADAPRSRLAGRRRARRGRRAAIEEIKRILTEQTDRSVYLALSELHARHS